MQTFLIIWIGQVISLLGSKLTEFALGFWILDQTYQDTGTITQFALTILFMYLPKVIISPLAGVLVDRWNRRSVMIMSDLGTGIVTFAILSLVWSNNLAVGYIYLALIISSSLNAFQQPAYMAAIAQLVPPKNLSRANGMVQASFAIAKIAAPAIAGLLMKFLGLETILFIDITTFAIAILTLVTVRFPDFKRFTRTRKKVVNQVISDAVAGWNYIVLRPGLIRLVCFIAISYFTMGMLEVVLWPLLYQPGSTDQLGIVLSVGGCGMLLGSVLMSVWSGPKNRVKAIISFVGFQGMIVLIGGLKVSPIILGIGIFGYLFSQPIIVSCNQAIWQSKVPTRLQGRVFALQQTLERSLAICAYLLAGPLVDNVLNPLMSDGGLIAQIIGRFININTGMGQGVTLLLVLLGIINIMVVAIAYKEPRLRHLETELPDRNQFNKTKTTVA
jgi:MFS transporter, DHA3 family, macrolide efflux protein